MEHVSKSTHAVSIFRMSRPLYTHKTWGAPSWLTKLALAQLNWDRVAFFTKRCGVLVKKLYPLLYTLTRVSHILSRPSSPTLARSTPLCMTLFRSWGLKKKQQDLEHSSKNVEHIYACQQSSWGWTIWSSELRPMKSTRKWSMTRLLSLRTGFNVFNSWSCSPIPGCCCASARSQCHPREPRPSWGPPASSKQFLSTIFPKIYLSNFIYIYIVVFIKTYKPL